MAAIKTVLVPARHNEAGAHLLSEAAAFAVAHEAHLVALAIGVEPEPIYGDLPDLPLDGYISGLRAIRQAVQETRTWAQERLAGTGASFEVRAVSIPEGLVGATVARHARYADLTILPRDDGDGNWYRRLDAALFESGHPVLLCPPGASLSTLGTRVVIGWDAGPEAARAVDGSIGLISGADDIRVVVVDPRVGGDGHGEDPGTDLATFLSRHGLRVTVDALPRENRSVADALLRHARNIDADLIVAGAYGHSRLSEIVLGGPTRDLMEATDRPLFMAH